MAYFRSLSLHRYPLMLLSFSQLFAFSLSVTHPSLHLRLHTLSTCFFCPQRAATRLTLPRPVCPFVLLILSLILYSRFFPHLLSSYRRITWNMTWACAKMISRRLRPPEWLQTSSSSWSSSRTSWTTTTASGNLLRVSFECLEQRKTLKVSKKLIEKLLSAAVPLGLVAVTKHFVKHSLPRKKELSGHNREEHLCKPSRLLRNLKITSKNQKCLVAPT